MYQYDRETIISSHGRLSLLLVLLVVGHDIQLSEHAIRAQTPRLEALDDSRQTETAPSGVIISREKFVQVCFGVVLAHDRNSRSKPISHGSLNEVRWAHEEEGYTLRNLRANVVYQSASLS
jgi:hypothetical protein